MTDFELARTFFERLKGKGFGVNLRDYNDNLEGTEHFNPEMGLSFEILNGFGEVCFTFDFLYGDFYRCSGFSEGFWYYCQTGADKLRTLWGYEAKKIGQDIFGMNVENDSIPQLVDQISPRLLKIAYRAKLRYNKQIQNDLQWNLLPLTHYYVYGGKVVVPKEHQWTVELWKEFK